MKYFDYTTMSKQEILELWDKLVKKERNCSMDIAMGCEDALTEKTLAFYRNAKKEIKTYCKSRFKMELV